MIHWTARSTCWPALAPCQQIRLSFGLVFTWSMDGRVWRQEASVPSYGLDVGESMNLHGAVVPPSRPVCRSFLPCAQRNKVCKMQGILVASGCYVGDSPQPYRLSIGIMFYVTLCEVCRQGRCKRSKLVVGPSLGLSMLYRCGSDRRFPLQATLVWPEIVFVFSARRGG